ncbi:MAG: hypothetical protein V2A64_01870 [Candidatus Omnitrophota bacterium]
MADLQRRIAVEIYNIAMALDEINKIKDKENKTKIELAGIATFLHNLYSGIENILKQILSEKNISIAKTEFWHKALLEASVENQIISPEFKNSLSDYLAFRHFFVHSYGFMLDEHRLLSLAVNASNIFSEFKKNIKEYFSE